MGALMSALAPLLPYLLAAGAALIAILGYGAKQRRAGAASERAKVQAAENQAIKDKKEKSDEIDSLAPADVDTRFDRWMRK